MRPLLSFLTSTSCSSTIEHMADDPTGDPTCRVCETYINTSGEFACYECMEKLKALMTSVTALDPGPAYESYSPSIEFKNVKLSSDYPGEAIVAIDGTGASGVQKPFKCDGQGKCIICSELTTDTLVCLECRESIDLVRQINRDRRLDFLILFQDEGFIALLKFVSSNAVKKYMEAEIEQFGKS